MEAISFTAIDVETMTAERTSACAIGLVRVENGVILQKFYSLINPVPDDREQTNSHVHGITPEMVASAPTFGELWPFIRCYLDGSIVVAHNAEFDVDVLLKTSARFGIEISFRQVIDTMAITHVGLTESCRLSGIPLDAHHDALCDATACARILLASMGINYTEHHYEKMTVSGRRQRSLSPEAKTPLPADEVSDSSTPFFEKRVVITGILATFPEREQLAMLLRNYGADINTSISSKTNIVIVGQGAGPSKMRKIEELREKGIDIRVIEEPELLQILDTHDMK